MTNIGVFDSGVGGLTVLSKLIDNKSANYFYFGDSLRAPYGNREKDQIIHFSDQIVDFLENFDIDKYVIACNTISVLATDYLSEKYNKEFIPITYAGIDISKKFDGDYLILATKTTVDSHFYKNNLENGNQKVHEVVGQGLVELIENDKINSNQMDRLLTEHLSIANEKQIENIILACTHFPIAKEAIKRNLGYEANIIDPANGIIDKLELEEKEENKIKIFMSEASCNTKKIIDRLIKKPYDLEIKEL